MLWSFLHETKKNKAVKAIKRKDLVFIFLDLLFNVKDKLQTGAGIFCYVNEQTSTEKTVKIQLGHEKSTLIGFCRVSKRTIYYYYLQLKTGIGFRLEPG